jgi:hypothetical protein
MRVGREELRRVEKEREREREREERKNKWCHHE